MNVLIVEDNANDRRLLRYIFEHHGCTVIEAQDGEQGLDLAARHMPDVIVSDALMPRMDGFQLLRALKADPRLKSIPFLFYSAAYTGEQETKLALTHGAEAFFIKPTEPEELWQKTSLILRAWEARQGEPARPTVVESEAEYLREYSHIVATKLEAKVLELEEALLQRTQAENEVRSLNAELEQRVRERTADLEQQSNELAESRQALMNLVDQLKKTNESLSAEIRQREQAQEEISCLNEDLQRQKLSLEDSNRELESFSYSVSHDLRAPLRHIDGFSLALLDECLDHLDTEGQGYLLRIRSSCLQMGNLIDGLLKLSRLSSIPLQSEQVDLSVLAREVIEQMRLAEPERRVGITVAEGVTVTGDATLLRSVMENLLGNAWKYTRKKEQPIIEFGTTEQGGRQVYYVRDNGAGFDMAYADKLFGVFQRLHKAEEFEGTGVGLATVQRIIHRHGGEVWAEAKVNEGAIFYFSLYKT